MWRGPLHHDLLRVSGDASGDGTGGLRLGSLKQKHSCIQLLPTTVARSFGFGIWISCEIRPMSDAAVRNRRLTDLCCTDRRFRARQIDLRTCETCRSVTRLNRRGAVREERGRALSAGLHGFQ